MLWREGLVVNHKKLFRRYREEKLAIRQRGGRKRDRDQGCEFACNNYPIRGRSSVRGSV